METTLAETTGVQREAGKPKPHYIMWFSEIGIDDIPLVGGKNASLGEMYRELTPRGIKIPNGFAITAQAYRDFLTTAGLNDKIHDLLSKVDTANVNIFTRARPRFGT
jgi:pyruvate,water dikinase